MKTIEERTAVARDFQRTRTTYFVSDTELANWCLYHPILSAAYIVWLESQLEQQTTDVAGLRRRIEASIPAEQAE